MASGIHLQRRRVQAKPKLFNEAKRDGTIEPPAPQREFLPFHISLALADDHMSSKEYRRISRFARKVGVNLNLIADIQAGKLNLATR